MERCGMLERRHSVALVLIFISVSFVTWSAAWNIYATVQPTINVSCAYEAVDNYISYESRAISSDWPMFGHDPYHTSRGIDAQSGIYQPSMKWSIDSGADTLGAIIGNFIPNIVGDVPSNRDYIVFSTNGGKDLVIVDGKDGSIAWSIPVDSLDNDTAGDIVISTPALNDFNMNNKIDIVFATNDGKVFALEPLIRYRNGKYDYANAINDSLLLWEYTTGGEITDSSITLGNIGNSSVDDVVVASTTTQGIDIHVIDGATGDKIWTYTCAGTRAGTPAIYPYSADSNRVVAVTAEFGTLSPYLYVYMIKDNGLKAWEKSFPLSTTTIPPQVATLIPSPAIGELDGNIINGPEIVVLTPFENSNGVVRVLTRDGGDLLWQSQSADVAGQFDSSPAIGDCDGDGLSDVIVVSWDTVGLNPVTHVYAFKGTSGTKLWERTIDTSALELGAESCIATPALTDLNIDGTVDVIVATTPKVYGLNGKDGTILWQYNITQTFVLSSSPAIGDVDRDGFIDIFIEGYVLSHNIVDLYISSADIEFTPSTVTEGESVTIGATVHNKGQGTGQNITVHFFDSNTFISEEIIDVIQGYDTYEVTTTWTPTTPGNHTIRVLLDPDNQIDEINEDDNEAAKVIYVKPRYIDLYAAAIKFYRADGMECDGSVIHPIAERVTTIVATVNNTGNKDATNISVSIYCDGNLIGDVQTISILKASGSKDVSLEYSGTIGTHTFTLVVDEDNNINESDEDNNTVVRSIYFKSPDPHDASYIISGLIYLPDGQSLASDVRITATNTRTGGKLTTKSDSQGSYSLDVKDIPGGYLEEDTVYLYYEKNDFYYDTSIVVYSEDQGAVISPVLREKENLTFLLEPKTANISVQSGSKGSVMFTITNMGNVNASYSITLKNVPSHWDVYLNPSTTTTTTVAPGSSYEFTVNIETPGDLSAGDLYTITIEVTCLQNTNISHSATITVEILPTYNVEMGLIDKGPWSIDPYGTNNYTTVRFYISNTGNTEDTYDLSYSSPLEEYLSIEFIVDAQIVDHVNLGYKENVSVEARIYVSTDIMATEDVSFGIEISASSQNTNISAKIGINIVILYPDLRVSVTSNFMVPSTPIVGLPLVFKATVANIGDGYAPMCYIGLFRIDTLGTQQVSITLDSIQISGLSPGETKDISLTWSSVEGGIFDIKIVADMFNSVAESNKDNNAYTIKLTLLPDLTISSVSITADTIQGGYTVISISVEVSNLGNIDVEETSIAVYYKSSSNVNRNKLGIISVKNIAANSKRSVEYTFELYDIKSGKYEFIFIVDPMNTTWELKEDNNEYNIVRELEQMETGRGQGTSKPSESMESGLIILIVIFISILFIWLFYRMRRYSALTHQLEEIKRKKGLGSKDSKTIHQDDVGIENEGESITSGLAEEEEEDINEDVMVDVIEEVGEDIGETSNDMDQDTVTEDEIPESEFAYVAPVATKKSVKRIKKVKKIKKIKKIR